MKKQRGFLSLCLWVFAASIWAQASQTSQADAFDRARAFRCIRNAVSASNKQQAAELSALQGSVLYALAQDPRNPLGAALIIVRPDASYVKSFPSSFEAKEAQVVMRFPTLSRGYFTSYRFDDGLEIYFTLIEGGGLDVSPKPNPQWNMQFDYVTDENLSKITDDGQTFERFAVQILTKIDDQFSELQRAYVKVQLKSIQLNLPINESSLQAVRDKLGSPKAVQGVLKSTDCQNTGSAAIDRAIREITPRFGVYDSSTGSIWENQPKPEEPVQEPLKAFIEDDGAAT